MFSLREIDRSRVGILPDPVFWNLSIYKTFNNGARACIFVSTLRKFCILSLNNFGAEQGNISFVSSTYYV